jgi:hypothetical protein
MPLPSRRHHQSRVITASAYKVGDRDSDYSRRQELTWQNRALEYTRIVPELNFASRFYSRMLKQLRLFPALRNAQDDRTEIKTGVPVEELNRVSDPGGGKTQILSNYGRLMFATGEGLLFGRALNSEKERWSFVWTQEVRVDVDSQGKVRSITHKLANGEEITYGPDEAVCYRMWTSDPGFSSMAEAPMQAALEVAEELITLTKSVQATATTRLLNGILFMPSEVAPPPDAPQNADDPEADPWAADFIEHIETQIQEPGTARARVPLISWVAGEQIENIKWMQLHDPQNDYMERELRKEAIVRLAYGLDMPPEALTGLGNTNHWAAMQILAEMWKSHGAPLAIQFCEELTSAYLQPALRQLEYPDWENVIVDYDASKVTVKADRSEDMLNAIKVGGVGYRGLRESMNIPEEWAPDEEEFEKILRVLGRGGTPKQLPAGTNGDAPEADPSRDGPPLPGAEGDSGRRTRVVSSAAFAHEAMGAAMMALARCRELAGIRLWQKQRICPDCFQNADGQPHALVASIVGPRVVEQLDWDPMRLVRGGADTLRDILIYWDFSDKQAAAICEMVESFAARTLYDERLPQLPSGFAAHLERARGMDALAS